MEIKMINFVFFATFCFINCMQPINTSSLENNNLLHETCLKHISQAILDDAISIGVFEKPPTDDNEKRIIPLKSGVTPEMEKDFFDLQNRFSFTKVNLIQSIKGNFDRVIFIPVGKQNVGFSDPYSQPNIHATPFYSDSKWILFLKAGFDDNNKPLNGWVHQLTEAGDSSYINKHTVFLEQYETFGALNLHWPEEYAPPAYLQKVPEEFINVLKDINNKINKTKNKQEKQTEITELLIQYKSDEQAKALLYTLKNIL